MGTRGKVVAFFPVGFGGGSGELFELAVEVGDVVESAFVADLGNV